MVTIKSIFQGMLGPICGLFNRRSQGFKTKRASLTNANDLHFQVRNEESAPIELLIEPHLDLYVLKPEKTYSLVFALSEEQPVPSATVTVSYRRDQIVVYPPGNSAPDVFCDQKLLEPDIA